MLCLCMLAGSSAFAYDAKIDGIFYNFNGDNAEVTNGTKLYTGDVVIPQTVTFNGKIYNVTSIGEDAFCNCSNLISVTIPVGVTSIGELAFGDCSLTSITIPESVTSIADYAFQSWIGQTPIIIPEGVTSIGDYAFGWSNLTSVTIPASVTSIGINPFESCSDLSSIIVAAGNSTYDSRNNCNAIIETATNTLIMGCKNTIIPESVTRIEDEAFFGCSGLANVNIPDGVISIGNSAFGCCRLTSITIPESVTSIGEEVFGACQYLTSITVAAGNNTLDSRNNCNAIIETATNTLIAGCKKSIIPVGVTSIGNGAFYGYDNLTAITIPESVKSIGERAFADCSLTSIIIPEGVTSIGDFAFGWNKLTSVTIPASVTSIGESSFQGCDLNSIIVAAGNNTYDSRENSNAIIETATNTLIRGCENTIIPKSVTSIGNRAFMGCDLISITIPEGVTSIGERAFTSCRMNSITIPASVTSIGNYAFIYCTQMKDFYCFAKALPSINANAFTSYYISNATLHVPAAAIEVYSSTIPWSGFGSIVADETAIGTIKGNQNEQNEDVLYDLNGRKLSKLQRGINIVRDSDGSAKKVLAR